MFIHFHYMKMQLLHSKHDTCCMHILSERQFTSHQCPPSLNFNFSWKSYSHRLYILRQHASCFKIHPIRRTASVFLWSCFFFQENNLVLSFDFILHCIEDLLLLNNSLFNNFYISHLAQSIWDKEHYAHQNSTPYLGIQIIPLAKWFQFSTFECPYCMLQHYPMGYVSKLTTRYSIFF